MPFSRRIGLWTSALPRSSSTTGRRLSAIPPANPFPTGTRTPRSTSSSIPTAAGHQLVRLLVEQQHSARVGGEDRADSRQQNGEELVELEMRKRDVRDHLHVLELCPCALLRLEGACVLDRERGTVGGELQ